MRNLLNVAGGGRPKPGLTYAAVRLLAAGQTAGELADGGVVHLEAGEGRDAAMVKILRAVNSLGRNLGPAQNARQQVDRFYNLALVERYDFNNDAVCDSFGYFLLAYVTEGFEDSDTTGTQMGNFQGEWRGGGFGGGVR